MELAKNCIDVGLFTNRIAEMRVFYGERIGLKFEEMLPLGGGLQQHRFALRGSVLKINDSRDQLGPPLPAGYSRLTIADSRLPMQLGLADPDGNYVELRPPNQAGVSQIEIAIGVSDEDAFERFYGEALGAERIEPRRFKIGETVISFTHDPRACKAPVSGSQSAIDALASMRAIGFRYITIQVRDCDAEHRRLLRMGVSVGSAPTTLGAVARICFIRDPDGNWIEISQRASLTGPLPKD